MRFTGKVALITAAGRGIGRASAEIIGREGGTVVAVEVDKDVLDQVVGAIRSAGGTAHGLVADALDGAQVSAAVRRVVDEHGRIDILVNAVGGSTIIPNPSAPVGELTLDDLDQPAPDGGYFYLVRGRDAGCGGAGSFGTDSNGVPRIAACP